MNELLIPVRNFQVDREKIMTALYMGKSLNLSLFFLGIIDTTPLKGYATNYKQPDQLRLGLREEGKNTIKRIRAKAAEMGIHVRTDLIEGDPKVEIPLYAKKHDYVFFGVKRMEGVKKLNPQLEYLISNIKKPILIVDEVQETFDHLVLALDVKARSEKTLDYLKKYNEVFQIKKITLVHVILKEEEREESQAFLDDAARELEGTKAEVRKIIDIAKNQKEIAKRIAQIAKEENADFIVVEVSRKGILEKFLKGSVSRNILEETTMPLVIVS